MLKNCKIIYIATKKAYIFATSTRRTHSRGKGCGTKKEPPKYRWFLLHRSLFHPYIYGIDRIPNGPYGIYAQNMTKLKNKKKLPTMTPASPSPHRLMVRRLPMPTAESTSPVPAKSSPSSPKQK